MIEIFAAVSNFAPLNWKMIGGVLLLFLVYFGLNYTAKSIARRRK